MIIHYLFLLHQKLFNLFKFFFLPSNRTLMPSASTIREEKKNTHSVETIYDSCYGLNPEFHSIVVNSLIFFFHRHNFLLSPNTCSHHLCHRRKPIMYSHYSSFYFQLVWRCKPKKMDGNSADCGAERKVRRGRKAKILRVNFWWAIERMILILPCFAIYRYYHWQIDSGYTNCVLRIGVSDNIWFRTTA